MPIQLTDKLAYPNRGTVTRAFAYGLAQGAKRQDFLMAYLTELYRLCAKYNLDFSILVAQSANETDAWRSQIWLLYGNPAGIGVTGTDTSAGTNYSLIYKNGADAARAHVVHMFAYVRGTITTGAGELSNYIALDPRYDAVTGSSKLSGSVATIADFNVNGRWALLNTPPPYGQRIVNSGMDVWGDSIANQDDPPVTTPSTPEVPVEGEPVAVAKLDYSSLSFPVEVRFIPAGQTMQRPGTPMTPTRTTWHDTGNPSAGARSESHAVWMGLGCPDANGNPTYTSWHFTVDDQKAIQHIPLNEVAWHAGDGPSGPGNTASIGIEECVNSDRNAARTRSNAAELHAFLIKSLNLQGGTINGCVQHNYWSGKDCPHVIRAGGLWAEMQNQIRSRLGAPTTPAYDKPQPPKAGDSTVNGRIFLAHAAEYTTKKDVVPRVYADQSSPATGPTIKAGTKVKTSHLVRDMGESADLTAVLVDGSRIPVKGVLV